jgi:chromosomal replication initiator protein
MSMQTGAVPTSGPSHVEQAWARVRGRLRDELGEAAFSSWLKPTTLIGVDDGAARIAVPTKFMRDWVDNHYGDRIAQLMCRECTEISRVELIVGPPALFRRNQPQARFDNADGQPANDTGLGMRSVPGTTEGMRAEDADGTLARVNQPLDERFTFDRFVVGDSNELAFAAARRVASGMAHGSNPLFLYGGVGLGKTHLMHAIAWHCRQHMPERRILYLTAEKFTYRFIRALQDKTQLQFKTLFRSVDMLMVDDIQFIARKESTQTEFFHTLNELIDSGKQVVISGDRSPGELEGIEERIKSRLGWGLVANLLPTSYELRLGILRDKRAHAPAGDHIPDKVLELLAHRITANVRELEGALNRLIANADLLGRTITLDTATELLGDMLRFSDRRPTIDEIQRKVAEHYDIKLSDMSSARRSRVIARPRQIAMFLCKQLTARSLPEIGRKFGGRDHTTVMHAVKKVEELCSTDRSIRESVDLLSRMLER